MPGLQASIMLYVETLKKLKERAEKNPVRQAAVYNGEIYMDGQPYEYESVSANRIVNGDVVYVAQTDNDGRVVVLG